MAKSKTPVVAQPKPVQTKQTIEEGEPQVARILNTLPSEDRAIMMAAIQQESFSGPLPHPQYYEGYEKVLPGSANRILTMTESQVQHRISIEKNIVRRSLNQKVLGMIFGGILTILILCAVVYLGLNGHDFLAGTIGTTTIIGVIVVFVLGVKPGNNNKEEKEK